MANESNIRVGMEVVGSFGEYVGKVDRIAGSSIRLAHEDPASGPEADYHLVPLKWVRSVDDAVHLDRPLDDVTQQWQTTPASG